MVSDIFHGDAQGRLYRLEEKPEMDSCCRMGMHFMSCIDHAS